MITLKTLPLATAQEVFEQGARHLLTQMEKCVSQDNGCRYRQNASAEDKLRCAAGCFIGDAEYDPNMEGHLWEDLVARKMVPNDFSDLISALQLIHDGDRVECWRDELYDLAVVCGLDTTFMKEI